MKYFKPQSPDPFIKKDADMALAKFGHLNAIVNELNQFHLNQTVAAYAGGGQALATHLISGINIINTTTNGDSVVLPCIGTCSALSCKCCVNNDVAAESTAPVVIKNIGPGTLSVYPCPGVAIDGLPINTPVVVPVGSSIFITRLSCSDWESYGCCVTGAGPSGVLTVTGCLVDNTDPANPFINPPTVDNVTITGTGCPGDPLTAVIPPSSLPCIVTPAPSYTPVLPELSVLRGTGAPANCLDVCIDGVTITKNVNGCLQALPAGGGVTAAMFVQQTQNTNISVAPGTAILYNGDDPFGFNNTAGITTGAGPGGIGTAFLLPAGTYMIDYENSADAAWSLAIYSGLGGFAGPYSLYFPSITGASTATTWLHGRTLFQSSGHYIIISPVTGTHTIPTAGTAAGEFIARITFLKIA